MNPDNLCASLTQMLAAVRAHPDDTSLAVSVFSAMAILVRRNDPKILATVFKEGACAAIESFLTRFPDDVAVIEATTDLISCLPLSSQVRSYLPICFSLFLSSLSAFFLSHSLPKQKTSNMRHITLHGPYQVYVGL